MNIHSPRKLVWQIFPPFLIIIIISLSFVTYYSTDYFRKFFLKSVEKELSVNALLLQNSILDKLTSGSQVQAAQVDSLCKEIGSKTDTRVTVILPDGKVIGDSFVNTSTMDNHRSRPEIARALKGGKGVSIRYSNTLKKSMMYVAMPLSSDSDPKAVIRTSVSVSGIDKKIKDVKNNILSALFLSILSAAAAGFFIAKRIARPVERMKEGALEFAAGNLEARLEVPATEELAQLAGTMNRMARNLDEKIHALENRRMELEAVHSSMLEGVVAIDEQERIITINAAAARMFEFPAIEVKGRSILELARNVEFRKFIEQALATQEPYENIIYIRQAKELVLQLHSTALYDSMKNRLGTLIILHDITRLKQLETMHKAFAANVSHELKTPLTSIKGFIETLRDISSGDTEERRNFLRIIDKNVDRMIDLIDDLLSLSSLERRQGTEPALETQEMSTLIHVAVNTLQGAVEEKNIQVGIDCPDDLFVRVDSILMEQAIVNLVDNAVKYSEHDGRVDISARKLEKTVEIEVRDNGCGITEEHQSKIFNRFYRVDKARSRQMGGTGLGLAIVKHIVQYHNGRVEVLSRKNRGSSFKITIPA